MTEKEKTLHGLTCEQVEQRIRDGLVNSGTESKTKSYRQIIKDNLLTFFNILNVVLAVLVIIAGSYKDMAFLLVVVANLVIGIVKEISAKKTLDKLAVLVQAKATVIRDGKAQALDVSKLVKDDLLVLRAGNQVCADCIVVEGTPELNESLISGESDILEKKPGDFLYSGSFVAAGVAYARVVHVGEENYARKLTRDAKAEKKNNSQLMRSLNIILKLISGIIIPVGLLMYLKQGLITGLPWDQNIVTTVASLVSMIPEGLVLLTSMTLAASAVLLSIKKTLVQDLYSIESLARVDTLCLDKTGTLTCGEMRVISVINLYECDLQEYMGNLLGALGDDNATFTAVQKHFGSRQTHKVRWTLPFSSQRKVSGACMEGIGCVFMGAFEFLFSANTAVPEQMKNSQLLENRVLAVGWTKREPEAKELPDDLIPIALIVLADEVRQDAKKTLDYFKEQGVDVKILSGDNVLSVATVARMAGHEGACVDATTLKTQEDLDRAVEEYSVFGRVLPDQKRAMVKALQRKGHVVAMVGDGVNDVLALKDSDCSIAMAQGSDAARNISDLVLMDSSFASMPSILCEGRRVINNIQRVATLFFTKTCYSVMISLMTLLLPKSIYPFTPFQLTLLSFITIGFPAFFLTFEPNNARIEGNFLQNVLKKSLPGALCTFAIIVFINVSGSILNASSATISTLAFVLVTIVGLWVVVKVSTPFTKSRLMILAGCIAIFAVCVIWLKNWFDFVPLSWQLWVLSAVIAAIVPLLMHLMEKVAKRLIDAHNRRAKKKRLKIRTPFF